MRSTVTLIAIDLAKNVFQVHGYDAFGKRQFANRLKRDELLPFMVQQPRCTVVTESCGGSQYWARQFKKMGHEPKLIAAQFVKPFRRSSQKNDRNDADAIAEAAMRPNMRFVAVKTTTSQDLQSLHRVRRTLVEMRIAMVNQCRGLAMEYGVVMDKSFNKFKQQLPLILEEESELTPPLRQLLSNQFKIIKNICDEIDHLEEQIKTVAKENPHFERLLKVPGMGAMSTSLFLAAVGDVNVFKNGRHLAAWTGLVPRQSSSGNETKLGSITKAGDSQLRSILIHGARALILSVVRKGDQANPDRKWIKHMVEKKGWNITSIAIANKNCRIMWHLMKYQEEYKEVV